MERRSTEPDGIAWDVLDRYLSGHATDGDHTLVRQWMASSPEQAVEVDALSQLVRDGLLREGTPYQHPTTDDVDRRATLVLQHPVGAVTSENASQSRNRPKPTVPVPATARRTNTRMAWVGSAAVAIAVIVGLRTIVSPLIPKVEPAQRIASGPNERRVVHLANGSTMILAPRTTATVSSTEVTVTGAAYFTVVPHTSRPFVVRAGNAEVRVLGTRFMVRHYDNERAAQVVVDDGRVSLQRVPNTSSTGQQSTPHVLSADMVATLSDSGTVVTSIADTRTYTGWTTGTLVFNRVPLSRVVAELERAYAAHIRITDSALAEKRVIIELKVADLPLAQVLDFLGVATGAHCQRDGDTYVLAPGRVTRDSSSSPQRDHRPQPETSYGK